jgi:hypothetical protein
MFAESPNDRDRGADQPEPGGIGQQQVFFVTDDIPW